MSKDVPVKALSRFIETGKGLKIIKAKPTPKVKDK